MDHSEIVQLVLQFLKEHNYHETFQKLESESSLNFDESRVKNGGELLNRLFELEDLRNLTRPLSQNDEHSRIDRELRKEVVEQVIDKPYSNLQKFASPILSLKFVPDQDDKTLLLCGSSDRTVKLLSVLSKEEQEANPEKPNYSVEWDVKNHTAAILSLDHNSARNHVLVGSMDGSFSILSLLREGEQEGGKLLQREEGAHKKYLSRVCWLSSDCFMTGGYDNYLKVWKFDEQTQQYSCVHSHQYGSCVESIVSSKTTGRAIIGVRNDNYLHYIDHNTLQDTTINMNPYGDDHVSFTPMNLNLSEDSQFLLCSTDKDRLVMYQENTPFQIRSFWGTFHDGLSQPRSCFSRSRDYVYSNSGGTKLLCWSVSNAQLVSTFGNHSSGVRSLDFHPEKELLCSGSFDKTIKVWSCT